MFEELKAEGVELKFSNEELGKLIASVQKAGLAGTGVLVNGAQIQRR